MNGYFYVMVYQKVGESNPTEEVHPDLAAQLKVCKYKKR